MSEDHFEGFYTVIPSQLLYDLSFSANEIRLYGTIINLCNKRGYCWATNNHFSEKLNVSIRSIQKMLSHLQSEDWIITFEEITNKGSQRRIKAAQMKFNNNIGDELQRHPPMNQSDTPPCLTGSPINNYNINKDKSNNISIDDIDNIYLMYPTKCPISNRSTGKSKKNKDKIKTILKETSKEELSKTIVKYISECKTTNTFIKDFGTFLNNLPDYSTTSIEIAPKDSMYKWKWNAQATKTGTKEQYEKDKLYQDREGCGFITIQEGA